MSNETPTLRVDEFAVCHREQDEWADFARQLERELSEMRERKNEGYQALDTSNAFLEASQRMLDDAKAENAELKLWKESMLQVESEWDAQALAKQLGGTLGLSCRQVIAKRVPVLLAERERLLLALDEALEYFENREDVEDGDYGQPRPNAEMKLAIVIRAAIAKGSKG